MADVLKRENIFDNITAALDRARELVKQDFVSKSYYDDALAQIGISHMQYKNNHFINNAGKEYTLQSYLSSHQKPVIYQLRPCNPTAYIKPS